MHLDTDVTATPFGEIADMGAVYDSHMEVFAKRIFENMHEFYIGFLTFHANWFAGTLLKCLRCINIYNTYLSVVFSFMAFNNNSQIHRPDFGYLDRFLTVLPEAEEITSVKAPNLNSNSDIKTTAELKYHATKCTASHLAPTHVQIFFYIL